MCSCSAVQLTADFYEGEATPLRQDFSDLRRLGFQHTYNRHKGIIQKTILSLGFRAQDLDDLLQEVFLKIWQNICSIENGRATRAWLVAVTRNACINEIKKRIRSRKTFSNESEVSPSVLFRQTDVEAPPCPLTFLEVRENLIAREEMLERLREHLGNPATRLTSASRARRLEMEAAQLRYVEGIPVADIAARLNLPRNTVLSHLLRFRKRMQTAIAKDVASPGKRKRMER